MLKWEGAGVMKFPHDLLVYFFSEAVTFFSLPFPTTVKEDSIEIQGTVFEDWQNPGGILGKHSSHGLL